MANFEDYGIDEDIPEEDVPEDGDEEVKNETSSVRSGSATPVERLKEKDKERTKLPVKYIENRTRRHVTFAKRRLGIMKKAYELSVLTGANILLLILSRTGLVYTFTTPKLEPMVRDEQGKELIRACLRSTASNDSTPTAFISANSTPGQRIRANT